MIFYSKIIQATTPIFLYTSKYRNLEFLEKKSNFSLNGFSGYLTPNMAV